MERGASDRLATAARTGVGQRERCVGVQVAGSRRSPFSVQRSAFRRTGARRRYRAHLRSRRFFACEPDRAVRDAFLPCTYAMPSPRRHLSRGGGRLPEGGRCKVWTGRSPMEVS